MTARLEHVRVQGREREDAQVGEALQDYLDAIQASVAASRALLAAGPGERTRAHHAFMEATRRQAIAERNYERIRQHHRGAAFAGRPRMTRHHP